MESPPSGIGKIYIKGGVVSNYALRGRVRADPFQEKGDWIMVLSLSKAETQSVLNSLQQQGGATTVAPSGTAVGAPKFKSFRAAAEYYDAHPEEAKAMASKR